jgi:DNA-directed RNA polymerase sigma subunit (sigma70/sigma32)
LVLGDIDFNSFIDFIEDDEFCSETLNEDSYKETCDKIINYLKEKEYKIPLLKRNK